MTIKNVLNTTIAILALIIGLAACQEDPGPVGSEILGEESPSGILDDSHTVTAYSKKLAPVQTNGLPVYQLGVYNNPVYGKSKANLLSQVVLESNNPKFGDSAVVDSVFVYLPFFSEATPQDSIITYKLDSIYGNDPIKISVYESGYYLREYDPASGFEKSQPYFSNQSSLFETYLGQELAVVEEFKPSDKGYVFNKGESNEEKLEPGLRIALPAAYFQEKIVDKEGDPVLRNNSNFRDYFRGLYFKVDSPGNNGSLFFFDIGKAKLSMYYSFEKPSNPDERDSKEFVLKFNGINVNTFDNAALPQDIQTALENQDTISGEPALYLRGGEGIISVVELFGKDSNHSGVADELETLREKKWLVNEANLIFYVNQDLIPGGQSEPDRIMIYNLKDGKVLADYNQDPTLSFPPAEAARNHLGKLERGSDEKGKYYKLKLTSHISNLINKDSTNVPLGIVVSQNVAESKMQKLENTESGIGKIPSGAVISPKGTVLYGNTSANEEKRLKLQIYYTEPN